MEMIKGYVEHIVFRNEENGYTVFNIENENGELTCVGNFPYLSEGELLELSGEYTQHAIYGQQFKVISHEIKEAEDIVSMERYLGSGAISGVGAALAGRIVKKFKEDTFRVIEEEPERLVEVKGISERKAREIAEQMEEKKDMRKTMIFLQKYGISVNLAAKIYQQYGQNVYRVLEENPYQLADSIQGVGFKTADEIAEKIGIRQDSKFRMQSGIFYTLLQSVAEGHIYLPKEELLDKAGQLLKVEVGNIEKHLMDLSIERKIVVREIDGQTCVYPSVYYYMELNVAKMLHDLDGVCEVADVVIEDRMGKIEANCGLSLDEKQREAVVEAVRNGVFILTGGPGTGKTTTINAMIHYFESEGMDFLLAAPTGRAAKRMSETTGYEAQTIHRLLEVNGNPEEDNSGSAFGRNEENPLESDVIIIDEMSMVDLPLLHSLLKAVSVGTRLILVGDRNQLPSVGPGSVLKDMINSGCFSMIELTKIFRQASESDIVINAHRIKEGKSLIMDNKSKDFFFLKRMDANTVIAVTLALIQKKLPKYVDADMYDIQVLVPMRKGALGVERLNTILQQYLNPPAKNKAEKEYGDRIFRVGDKVMQIKNNYQLEWEIATRYGLVVDKGLGVFNGDMGVITEIHNKAETLIVEYDEKKKVEYTFKMLDELEHAYAITIHKAQGSEYPAVVMPILTGPRQLLHRNLLYTAVTRAKRCVTLVGDDAIIQRMIQNVNEQKRYTSLAARICEFWHME